MAIDIEDVLDRCVALEKEALLAINVTADAVPYYFHTQEAFPYFTNRLSSISAEAGSGGDDDYGEELDVMVYEIVLRLTVSHLRAGVPGEYEDKLALYVPRVIEYFNARELLQSGSWRQAASLSSVKA